MDHVARAVVATAAVAVAVAATAVVVATAAVAADDRSVADPCKTQKGRFRGLFGGIVETLV